jgi:hypothetical protein
VATNVECDPHIELLCQDGIDAKYVHQKCIKSSGGYSYVDDNSIIWFSAFNISRVKLQERLGCLGGLVTRINYKNMANKRGKVKVKIFSDGKK